MANKRLAFFNAYSATASGVDPYTDEISVDALPDGNDWARDSFAMPLAVGDGVTVVCTGWQQSPAKLWIDPCGQTVAGPATVMCAPSADTQAMVQSTQLIAHTITNPGDIVYLETGVTNFVEVNAAGTLAWTYGDSGSLPGIQGLSQTTPVTKAHRGVTRVVLYDVDGDQPALTWSGAPIGASIHWETAAPSFDTGKPLLLVDVLGVAPTGYTLSVGSFRRFA